MRMHALGDRQFGGCKGSVFVFVQEMRRLRDRPNFDLRLQQIGTSAAKPI
jgi:hypothetical protein